MTEEDLVDLLDDLVDDEFKKLKWHLKIEKADDIEPIKANQLAKADRQDTVDLMVQKYQLDRAVRVMKSVLKKINRNDLVTKLPNISSGAEGPGPAETQSVPADEKLKSVREQFIARVSEPNLRKLLDKLLDREIINDDEMEFAGTPNRADKARLVIDMVRRKGTEASSALIDALCEVDRCLSKELKLQ
ncbi:caspase b-like [Thunnus albacares]|uniref:caspase b-like n=1 Tax=Thunnus albacares TaxID=8236 RepID=UPI001CF6B0DA|nr:caspase b-like [Thunnus albacares]